MCELTAARLPPDRPRYLMGVGTPLDILEAVHRGVDMFDCSIPTSLAKRGGVFTSRGYLQLRRGVHKYADEPLDPLCACPTCRRHSRAYLHHLTKTQETLGWQLLGQHNLYVYHRILREIRASILADTFLAFYREKRTLFQEHDVDNPAVPPPVRPVRPLALGQYEVHLAREGFASIRHVPSGEIMHAHTPPLDEARSLYVEQAQLAERLRLRGGEDPAAAPLVVWDVGLGAAANALAAIRCYEAVAAAQPVRALRIVSFENDLDALRLAFASDHHFRYLRHSAPAALLSAGAWDSKTHSGLSWRLVEGDACALVSLATPPPDLVFYDLFSSKTHAQAWTLSTFRRLSAACADRDVELFTYTASTCARVALLGAGFYVAKGRATDDKPESTIAFTRAAWEQGAARRHTLLGADWLSRWRRSGAKYPTDLPVAERPAFEQRILQHAQFRPS
jgi:queuine tRNA-ribosyltransferase